MPKNNVMKAWVTRDIKTGENFYNIHMKKPSARHLIGLKVNGARVKGHWIHAVNYVCPEIFEKHFFKLKPGAGPVPVDIMIKLRGK